MAHDCIALRYRHPPHRHPAQQYPTPSGKGVPRRPTHCLPTAPTASASTAVDPHLSRWPPWRAARLAASASTHVATLPAMVAGLAPSVNEAPTARSAHRAYPDRSARHSRASKSETIWVRHPVPESPVPVLPADPRLRPGHSFLAPLCFTPLTAPSMSSFLNSQVSRGRW